MTSTTTASITLDVCTPEGKTWLSIRYGRGPRDREFIQDSDRSLSKSGLTGWRAYQGLTDGIYESNEGRARLGRRWWKIENGQVTEISAQDGMNALN